MDQNTAHVRTPWKIVPADSWGKGLPSAHTVRPSAPLQSMCATRRHQLHAQRSVATLGEVPFALKLSHSQGKVAYERGGREVVCFE